MYEAKGNIMLFSLFELFAPAKCAHEQITPDMDAGYCPDCGEYIENEWFITRCDCCGLKQKTFIKRGKVVPSTKFCKNCGNNSFFVEKLHKINLVDVNYAVLLKQVMKNKTTFFTQCWVEPQVRIQQRLIAVGSGT